jgi:hypothetical protein
LQAETEEAIILGSTRSDLYVPGLAVVKEYALKEPGPQQLEQQQCVTCTPDAAAPAPPAAAGGAAPAAPAAPAAAGVEDGPPMTCCPTCGFHLPLVQPGSPPPPERELLRMHLLSQWTEGLTITQLLEQGRTFSEDQAALELILPQLWAVYEHRKQVAAWLAGWLES